MPHLKAKMNIKDEQVRKDPIYREELTRSIDDFKQFIESTADRIASRLETDNSPFELDRVNDNVLWLLVEFLISSQIDRDDEFYEDVIRFHQLDQIHAGHHFDCSIVWDSDGNEDLVALNIDGESNPNTSPQNKHLNTEDQADMLTAYNISREIVNRRLSMWRKASEQSGADHEAQEALIKAMLTFQRITNQLEAAGFKMLVPASNESLEN